MKKRIYIVQSLSKNVGVELMGMERSIPLSFADGMIGALPVFDTLDNAQKFRESHDVTIAIAEIDV